MSITEHHSSSDLLLAPELWDDICSFLPKSSLFQLRLVCSKLNQIALPWAYREIRLEAFGDSVESFIQIAKSATLRHLVRDLTVDTSVDFEFAYNHNQSYPFPVEFLNALPFIQLLSFIKGLHIRFDENCGEDDRVGVTIEETWEFRYGVLDTICHCITGLWTSDAQGKIDEKADTLYHDYEREYPDFQSLLSVPNDEAIELEELTVANLADFYDMDLVDSKAFQKLICAPSFTSLKVFVATEINEDHDDSTVYYEEKYEFFKRLPETWLAPCISDNLRVLSLYYQDYWGWFPKMDFRDIKFPQLEVLAFGHYVFTHEWQIDWISSIGKENSIGGLRELYLDDCPILFEANQSSPLDDADPGYPDVDTVLSQETPMVYKYSMRWSEVLSKWVTSMKSLRVFQLGHGNWEEPPKDTIESILLNIPGDEIDEQVLTYRLSNNTHRNFDCPEPIDRAFGDEDPENVCASDKYLKGAGLDTSGGCKLQYIEYDVQVFPRPWQASFYSYRLDEEGFQPEEGTWAKDIAALEELNLVIKARTISL